MFFNVVSRLVGTKPRVAKPRVGSGTGFSGPGGGSGGPGGGFVLVVKVMATPLLRLLRSCLLYTSPSPRD